MLRLILVILTLAAPVAPAFAQQYPVAVPSYWDPRRKLDRPDMTRVPLIRFLIEDDYPPFNFIGADGRPAGFNVDLARAVCEELRVPCTVQVRRWDTLLDSLDRNLGDAVIASLATTPELRRRYDVSDRYLETPARFVMRSDTMLADATPEALSGRSAAVVAGSAHEAYLRAFFPETRLVVKASSAEVYATVLGRDVDVGFGDAVGLAFWLHGPNSEACCRFLGGAFTETRFFGEGMTIVMRRGADPLRNAVNFALQRLHENGRHAEIYLRSFPIGLY